MVAEPEKAILPYNVAFEDVDAIIDCLRKKSTGASIGSLRRLLPEKLFDARKSPFYVMTGLIAIEGGQWRLTSPGAEYAHASDKKRQGVLRQIISRFTPYKEILEWAFHENKEVLTGSELQHKWVTDFADVVSTENQARISRAPLTMFNVCQHAGLGKFVVGRRGAPSRFEFDWDELRAYLESEIGDTTEECSSRRTYHEGPVAPADSVRLHERGQRQFDVAPQHDQEIAFPLSNYRTLSVHLPDEIPAEDEDDIKLWFDLMLRRRMKRKNDAG